MSTPEVGKPAPDFSVEATGEQTISLGDLRGRNVVLYFYPKDNTPGCTLQGQGFRDEHNAFGDANTMIFGVSKDGLKAHANFCAKHEFPFDLLSDRDEALCQAYDVIKEKNMYGKKYMGIERSTFLIDKDGVLQQEWRKVKVKGHVDAVLEAAKELAASQ